MNLDLEQLKKDHQTSYFANEYERLLSEEEKVNQMVADDESLKDLAYEELDNIKLNGWIVIEDISIIDNWFAIDYIISSNKKYKTHIIKSKSAFMYVINKIE